MSLPHGKNAIRANVSIPRQLWEEAQLAYPGLNDSRLVQTALQMLVARQREAFERAGASPKGVLVEFSEQVPFVRKEHDR